MRPFRILFLLLSSIIALILLISITRDHHQDEQSYHVQNAGKPSALRSMLSFRTPLFPTSSIISLTDDNSTFFLSRPAAFGPDLPVKGLSGQLWIGSGFGEDSRGWIGVTSQPEGELGCSDVPGWEETYAKFGSTKADGTVKKPISSTIDSEELDLPGQDPQRRSTKEEDKKTTKIVSKPATQDDGTDNHLFQTEDTSSDTNQAEANADIQSLQESAEITGKVVLLSRGGCGFLEKAKWTQRRGGIALIVGDNVPGGPLVTMYARGDTSNITIPAIFTSHTTAHLLSSLIPLKNGGSIATTATSGSQKSSNYKGKALKFPGYKESTPAVEVEGSVHAFIEVSASSPPKSGFFRAILSFFGLARGGRSNTRPPHSGSGSWVLVDDWEDSKLQPQTGGDNFVIGVQDWRDPSLTKKPIIPGTAQEYGVAPSDLKRYSGGSITPGSGEYWRDGSVTDIKDKSTFPNALTDSKSTPREQLQSKAESRKTNTVLAEKDKSLHIEEEQPQVSHEGLWVTLTPTDMSSSPFFDTILVLVISPLITLTVVYAVLLIRSRIRRRRWRAPKSVVDKLPVRTYHTMASSGASSTALATPHASSPNTPLLLQGSSEQRPALSRSHSHNRPRSRTTSEVPGPSSYVSDEDEDFISMTESDKREKGLAAWRRRYGGRQKECVVCLEEYVDGVSRVMSLPCGHEFHVECITPWLTTRRRTCPICKGDVVRSFTRQDDSIHRRRPSSLPFNSSDDGDSLLARVATTRNDSPSAHEPIPTGDEDLERAESNAEEPQSITQVISDWWRRLRSIGWERADTQGPRGRSRRTVDDPDRDR